MLPLNAVSCSLELAVDELGRWSVINKHHVILFMPLNIQLEKTNAILQ